MRDIWTNTERERERRSDEYISHTHRHAHTQKTVEQIRETEIHNLPSHVITLDILNYSRQLKIKLGRSSSTCQLLYCKHHLKSGTKTTEVQSLQMKVVFLKKNNNPESNLKS